MHFQKNSYRYAMSVFLGFAWALSAGAGAGADHRNSPQRAVSLRLFAAIRKGDTAAVKRMLESGVSATSQEILLTRPRAEKHSEGGKEYPGESALLVACRFDQVAIIELLIQHGAPVNPRNSSKTSPIMEAVEARSVGGVRCLLEHGANANQLSEWGEPVTSYAVTPGDLNIVKSLLDYGADINAGKEKTLLMEAVSSYSASIGMVNLLLKRGADPNLRRNGVTALEIAEQRHDDKMVDVLRAAGARGRTKIQLQRIEDRRKRTTLPNHTTSQVRATTTKPVTRRAAAEDYTVIAAMVRDMLANRDHESPFYKNNGLKIVVDATTSYSHGYWDEQIEFNLSDEQANEITLAMRENLLSRNQQPALFDQARFGKTSVVVMPTLKLEQTFNQFGTLSKSYRGWLVCNLPGYSRKRNAAVVPFTFGPTPHGASGVCFLVRANRAWRVKWIGCAFSL